MMSPLMEMISPKKLYKVVGIACKQIEGESIIHVDEGRLYAAISLEDAEHQAVHFWTSTMNFDSFQGAHAKHIDKVDGYKILLVEDGES